MSWTKAGWKTVGLVPLLALIAGCARQAPSPTGPGPGQAGPPRATGPAAPAAPGEYVFFNHVNDARWARVVRSGEVVAQGVGRSDNFADTWGKVGGVVLPKVIWQHPEYKKGPGYTRAVFPDVPVPKGKSELSFAIGILDKNAPYSDGVVFKISVIGAKGKEQQVFEKAWSKKTNKGWDENTVGMSKYAGQKVQVVLTVDCGPNDNAMSDHGVWADLVLRPKS